MSKIKKGQFGYLQSQRRKTLLYMILLYGMAFVMYFGARAYFETNQNLFTILAVLVMLPAAKFTVSFIMLARAGECPQKVQREVEQHVGSLEDAYDLYFTSEKKNFNICHLAAAGKTLAAYTADPKCDCAMGEQHLRRMLMNNGFHGYQIKIFQNLSSYVIRLDQMNELESAGDHARQEELFGLLFQISL